jgi:hypothetical protein
VSGLIQNIVLVTVAPPVLSWLWQQVLGRVLRGVRFRFYQGWIGAAVSGGFGFAWDRQWLWFLLAAANAGVAIVLWWLSRRRRKRAPRAYGAKSAALVAALVAKAREAARPRPVPRLGPAGARA